MSFQTALLLSVVVPVTVALGVAHLLVRKKKPALALVLGLAIVAAAEVYFQASLQWGVHNCIERACATGGLGTNCQAAEFGCTEWSGLSAVTFLAAGLLDAVAFVVGATIMVFRERHRTPPTG
jgi:hypothetical protein